MTAIYFLPLERYVCIYEKTNCLLHTIYSLAIQLCLL